MAESVPVRNPPFPKSWSPKVEPRFRNSIKSPPRRGARVIDTCPRPGYVLSVKRKAVPDDGPKGPSAGQDVRDYGGRFATCICCMDGRIQLPLLRFIQDRYKVRYVDIITEPGPIQYLAGHMNHSVLETIRKRLHISVDIHGSEVIAISGHYDCAGNPVAKREQWRQMDASADAVRAWGFGTQRIVKLWVDENWRVKVVR